jgi:hypothetical protein
MHIRVKPIDVSMFEHGTFSEIMLDDPQIYNWARLAFGIEDGVDIECLDIMEDRIIARLVFSDDA